MKMLWRLSWLLAITLMLVGCGGHRGTRPSSASSSSHGSSGRYVSGSRLFGRDARCLSPRIGLVAEFDDDRIVALASVLIGLIDRHFASFALIRSPTALHAL